MNNQEWTEERRLLIELVDDISSRLRNGASSAEVTTMLETALDEASNLDKGHYEPSPPTGRRAPHEFMEYQKLVRPNPPPRYPEDARRLKIALNALGYDSGEADIAAAYEDFSETEYSAGWMSLNAWESDMSAARRLVDSGYLVLTP
jgi:hypothetical protein